MTAHESETKKSDMSCESEILTQLDFDNLHIGDVIMLETKSGSSYKISISLSDDPTKTCATLQRSNERSGVVTDEQTSWESVDNDTIFDLKGSCERTLSAPDGLRAIGETEGLFMIDQRAWFETDIEGKSRTLITSSITRMDFIPAP